MFNIAHLSAVPMVLNLFEGEGGAAAATAGAAPAASQGETNGVPAPTRQAKKSGEYDNVVFGKQPQQPAAAQGEPAVEATENKKIGVQSTSNTLTDKKAAWRELVEGEYKDMYTQDTQRIINERFKETKRLQETLDGYQPIIDVLAQRYGVNDGDMGKLAEKINNDSAYWSEAAEEAGLTVEQYKEMQRLQRENKALQEAQRRRQQQEGANRQLQQWYAEAEALKAKMPGFSLENEVQNQQFMTLLRSGVPMEHAYKVMHMDEMMMDAMQTTAARTQQRVTDNIRARGTRPAEAGITAQSGYTVKDDVTKLTKKDRAEIARRAARGESISF